ncbi:hypothetical protein J6590_077338 [Homalodisca vitripennis]|nr:hypothetical protein J6590_077338 [Homalodisca vitripennis]
MCHLIHQSDSATSQCFPPLTPLTTDCTSHGHEKSSSQLHVTPSHVKVRHCEDLEKNFVRYSDAKCQKSHDY